MMPTASRNGGRKGLLGKHGQLWQSQHQQAPGQLTDQAVESQSFGENEDQNHAHKQLWLLGIGSVVC